MIGAIIGDIVGSIYEFDNRKTKEFPLFQSQCFFTDDSAMTIAVGMALLASEKDAKKLFNETVRWMRAIGKAYPNAGYGGMFRRWLNHPDPKPYGSLGNGAGMRVSACGIVASKLEEAEDLAYIVTSTTHNHDESYVAAQATAAAVFMARQGSKKEAIKKYIRQKYYELDFTLDQIRPTYDFNERAAGTTPQALQAFFESNSFEDAIRNAISIGGDSDTIAAITGAIAAEYYGVPKAIETKAKGFLTNDLIKMVDLFEKAYPPKVAE